MTDPVFVFGSNLAGRHGKGAARAAWEQYGAIRGRGVGHHGNSYAIPTKDANIQTLPLVTILGHVRDFVVYARLNPQLTFRVTPIGCGLAGYTPDQIGPMFAGAPDNVLLPNEFKPFATRPA